MRARLFRYNATSPNPFAWEYVARTLTADDPDTAFGDTVKEGDVLYTGDFWYTYIQGEWKLTAPDETHQRLYGLAVQKEREAVDPNRQRP
jgi:hypothetical protein